MMGAMSLLVLFAQRMIRMFDMYFSIVRRSAACASRVRVSASLMMTAVCDRAQLEYTTEMSTVKATERTFEPMSRVHIDLLCLRDLFEELLDDYAVVIADFAIHIPRGQQANRSVRRREAYLGVISR